MSELRLAAPSTGSEAARGVATADENRALLKWLCGIVLS
jgi:hypothetical protein